MKLVTRITERFILSERRRASPGGHGFVSFIAMISVAGLALGVTALLVVTSVMNGFERELKSALTAFHGHILLFSRGEPISKPEHYIEEIPKLFPDVIAVSPYLFAEVMLSAAGSVAGSIVEGIHHPTLKQVSHVGEKLTEGRLPQQTTGSVNPEITLGKELAQKLHVKVGDTIVLTIPFAKTENSPLVRRVHIVGLVQLGMYDYDSKYSLMEMQNFQAILEQPGKVNAFKLMTRDASKSIRTAESLNDKYVYPLRARDWSSLNRNLFYAIRLEKVVIAIILMAIVLVASFNIISTIMMMVHDKKKQISILKTLGFQRKSTFMIFLIIGSFMASLGALLGLGIARMFCAVLSWRSIIDLPPDVYMLSKIPIEIRSSEWILICVLTIALAIISTLIPSYRVAKESPVEGLRYE